MSTGTVILSSLLTLVGVAIGSWATLSAQRNSAREVRHKSEAEERQARRSETKAAITSFLEAAQHMQSQLYAREHGRDIPDIPLMVEDVWLAHAQVDILCSEQIRRPVRQYAEALNAVARHEDRYPDWWAYVIPFKAACLNAVRAELRGTNSTSATHELMPLFTGTEAEPAHQARRDDPVR